MTPSFCSAKDSLCCELLVYHRLLRTGRACDLKDEVVSLREVFDLVGVGELDEIGRKYLPKPMATVMAEKIDVTA